MHKVPLKYIEKIPRPPGPCVEALCNPALCRAGSNLMLRNLCNKCDIETGTSQIDFLHWMAHKTERYWQVRRTFLVMCLLIVLFYYLMDAFMVGLCYRRSILRVNLGSGNFFGYEARLSVTLILLWDELIYIWNYVHIHNSWRKI